MEIVQLLNLPVAGKGRPATAAERRKWDRRRIHVKLLRLCIDFNDEGLQHRPRGRFGRWSPDRGVHGRTAEVGRGSARRCHHTCREEGCRCYQVRRTPFNATVTLV